MSSIINQSITTNYVLMFVFGLLSVFVSLAPAAISIKQNPNIADKANLPNKFLYLPIFYGILSIIVFSLVNYLAPNNLKKYWFIGLIFGLIYPTLGYINRLPQEIYGVPDTLGSKIKFYISAIILYVLFYGIVISFIDYTI